MNVECRQLQVRTVLPEELERRVRTAVNKHEMFRGRANNFDFTLRDHVLTLRGKVPSFYLKQMLQTVVKKIDGVQAVNNRVEVIS